MTVYLLKEFGEDKNTGEPVKVLKIGKTWRNFWKRYREYITHNAHVRFVCKLGGMSKEMEKRFHELFSDLRYWGFDDEKQEWILREEFFYYNDDIVNLFNIMSSNSPKRRMDIFNKSEFLIKVCFNMFNIDNSLTDDESVLKVYTDFNLKNLRKTISDCLDLDLSWFKKMKELYTRVNYIVHK